MLRSPSKTLQISKSDKLLLPLGAGRRWCYWVRDQMYLEVLPQERSSCCCPRLPCPHPPASHRLLLATQPQTSGPGCSHTTCWDQPSCDIGQRSQRARIVPENKQAKDCRALNGVLCLLVAVDELKYPNITLYSWFLTVWLGCNSEASLCLSCLVYVYPVWCLFIILRLQNSRLRPIWGNFGLYFFKNFFSAHSLFSPFSVPMTQVLDHLISFKWSLNFCSNFSEFSLLCILHFESF